MSVKVVTLDVREDLRQGREPFSRIMQTVAGLAADEMLRLLAPFEPRPLFPVLARQGFSHRTGRIANGDWEVWFERGVAAPAAPPSEVAVAAPSAAPAQNTGVVEVDARGLEPPQPLVRILEAVATLPPTGRLRARTDRRPMHLYAQLAERGLVGETEEQSDGSYVTQIHHA